MATVTRADLAAAVHEETGLHKRDAADLVDTLFEAICERLAAGEPVGISGFGAFDLRDKQERVGRNSVGSGRLPAAGRTSLSRALWKRGSRRSLLLAGSRASPRAWCAKLRALPVSGHPATGSAFTDDRPPPERGYGGHREAIAAMVETSATSSTSSGSRPANASEATAPASV